MICTTPELISTKLKKCDICCDEKSLYEFHRDDSRLDGYRNTCKVCRHIQRKVRYSLNKSVENALSRTYAKNNHIRVLQRHAIARAKGSKLPYEDNFLTKVYKDIPSVCPVLGIPLFSGIGKFCSNSPSVDRIDSSKGYTSDNVMIISFRANTLKNNGTIDEFKKIIEYLISGGKVSAGE